MQTYQIFINLKKDIKIQIGKLGLFDLPKGNYIYTGSAKKNIEQRIKRHLANSTNKKLHWHIDYFLADKNTQITEIKKSEIAECKLNQQIKGQVIINGFGSSDCKKQCGSHLKYFG